MKLSHIIYRGKSLKAAVDKFTALGFKVEYGSKEHPHNAVIYFSEGPYIELLDSAPVSPFKLFLLRLMGKGGIADRFVNWGRGDEGFFEICLENYAEDFSAEEKVMKSFGQSYFITNSKRLDPQDRLLKWKMLFPMEKRLPFLMTYFNIDPKPKDFVHPNGFKKIKEVSYPVGEKEWIPLLKALCDDEDLKLVEGAKEIEIVYE